MSADYQSGFNLGSQWGYSAAHFQDAFSSSKSGESRGLFSRAGHFLLGVINAIPFVGFLSAFIEKKIVNLTPSLNQKNREIVLLREDTGRSGVLQRLYFETFRRECSVSESESLPSLDYSFPDAMLLRVITNMEKFSAEAATEEERAEIKPVLTKLQAAKELYLQLGIIMLESNPSKKECLRAVLAEDIMRKVSELKEGESCILPGGYTNFDIYGLDPKSAGHALLYEVTKNANGTYKFKVFNSGEGIGRHQEQEHKYSNVFVDDISIGKLNRDFFDTLTGFGTRSKIGGSATDIKKVYEHIKTLGDFRSDESFHYAQGGINDCAYQCLIRWVKDQVPKKTTYQRMQAHTIKSTLLELERETKGVRLSDTIRVRHSYARWGFGENVKTSRVVTAAIGFFSGDRVGLSIKGADIERIERIARVKLARLNKKLKNVDPISLSVVQGNIEEVKRLLEADPDRINFRDELGRTLLHLAVEEGKTEVIELLMRIKPSLIDTKNTQGQSPLLVAIQSRNVKSVELILKRNPSLIDGQSLMGKTPLYWAYTCGAENVVALLLERKPALSSELEALRAQFEFSKKPSEKKIE